MFDKRASGLDAIVPSDAVVERVACGFEFTEGPLWDGTGLLFSDIPRSRIVRLAEGPELTTYRSPSNLSNGLAFDAQRRLLACEGATRRLTRTESDGRITVLAESYKGKRINSPNDVVVARDGSIYFSDPFWGQGFANPHGRRVRVEEKELAFDGVFRVAPDGALSAVAEDFERPNGLAFSPDGSILYVDDTRRFHIRAFDVQPDGSLANGRVFADIRADEPGVPDGMKLDREGNVYCTGPGGTWVIAPSGEILGRIVTPEVPANVAWGRSAAPAADEAARLADQASQPGDDWSTLYITARTSVYRVRLRIPGVAVP